MSRIERANDFGTIKVVYDTEKQCFGLTASCTNHTVAAIEHCYGYWWLFAAASGLELQIYEERPEALSRYCGDSPPPAWMFEQGITYEIQCMEEAMYAAKELYEAATTAGIPLQTKDAAELQHHLNGGDFIVRDNDLPVLWVGQRRRIVKKRKVTQKLLDGGEDMTA